MKSETFFYLIVGALVVYFGSQFFIGTGGAFGVHPANKVDASGGHNLPGWNEDPTQQGYF